MTATTPSPAVGAAPGAAPGAVHDAVPDASVTVPVAPPEPREELSRQGLVRYLEDRFACAQACDECVRACLGRRGPAEWGDEPRLNTACADVCEATSRVLAEQSDQDEQRVRMQVEWCRAICLQCAALSALRPASALCAEACRRCAQACDDFLTTLG
ncbi:four-helix bundle copper-binding protein [Streptomyces sp. NPDC048518]|uniref:four-helix bundle copper-binding protein n=1 Tax=Streptomyces sp. NPDC048518 TaxID=3155029 RepID=UPI0033D994FE